MKLKTWVYPANWHWVASYYGKKDKEQKAEIIQAFKEGEKKDVYKRQLAGCIKNKYICIQKRRSLCLDHLIFKNS